MERAFAVLVLLVGSGAFMTLATTQGQFANQANGILALEIFWVVVYLGTAVLLIRHCKRFVRQFLKGWPILAFAVLAVLSTMWSEDPSTTFRRGVALSLTVMFGFYLANRFSLREQLHLLAWVCGICIFFSVPFQLLHVGAPVSDMVGAWYGVFVDKSIFGEAMALGFLIFTLLAKVEPSRRWRMRLGMLSAIVLLILSRSATPLVATLFMVVLLPLSGTLRKKFGKALKAMTLAAMGGAILVLLVLTHWAAFTVALGRGPTMSGRVQLWAFCVVMALRKPWLGYGYTAFWTGTNGPSYRILRALHIEIAHAHNAFLEVWLDLGLVGMALLVVIVALYFTRAALLVRKTKEPEAVWPFMFFAFTFIFMLTKVPIPIANSLYMMIFVSCAFAVSSRVSESVTEQSQLMKSGGFCGPLGLEMGHAPGSSSSV